jgi:hypothetical protein
VFRFEFKGKEPKFRIETPSKVIHVLKTPVSQETSGMQKVQIRSAIMRIIKRYGTSPPQNVSVVPMPNSRFINVLLIFLRTTLLGTVPDRQTRTATLVSTQQSGM